MESPDWTEINAGIQQHLQKAYNTNKAAFKSQHWVINPTTGTYDVEKIRRARTLPEPLKIGKTGQRAWSYLDRDLGRLLAFEMRWEFLGMRTDEEIGRLEATETYTADEINRLARGGKQRGHILGVGRVLPARATASPSGASGSGGCGNSEEGADHQDDEDEDGDGDT
nr:F-box domain, leucine-rich repeat domain, L domain-like protein [Tanacetum cinerariifolium]